MAQQDVLDYIRKTPYNSNVNVVKGMLGSSGGSSLPEVTAEDNGKVLTVVEGEWDKAAGGGGADSAFTVKFTTNDGGSTYTVDKTFAECFAAYSAFKPINAYVIGNGSPTPLQVTGGLAPSEDLEVLGRMYFNLVLVAPSDSYMNATSVVFMSDESISVSVGEFTLTPYE